MTCVDEGLSCIVLCLPNDWYVQNQLSDKMALASYATSRREAVVHPWLIVIK